MSAGTPDRQLITQMLSELQRDPGRIADRLLPLVYDELRRLAAARLAHEPRGQTLQSTALVHEAYMRLLGGSEQSWEHRGHFFASAAEAMRRILVENARRKRRLKHGGEFEKIELNDNLGAAEGPNRWDILDLEDALIEFERDHPRKAELIKLRYFAGLEEAEAADALGISRPTAARDWAFAKAWLFAKLGAGR